MNALPYYLIFLFTLSSGVAAADDVEVDVLVKQSNSWNGEALPHYPQGIPEISILRIRIPPGAELPMHQHPFINAGVLLSGELTVMTDDGETLYLSSGDSIVEVVDKWHYGKNSGEEIAEIMVFYAGIKDEAITIKR